MSRWMACVNANQAPTAVHSTCCNNMTARPSYRAPTRSDALRFELSLPASSHDRIRFSCAHRFGQFQRLKPMERLALITNGRSHGSNRAHEGRHIIKAMAQPAVRAGSSGGWDSEGGIDGLAART
jgi:hypothetical protein